MSNANRHPGRSRRSRALRSVLLVFAAAVALSSVPALADEHDRGRDRDHDRRERVVHERREHRYYAPPPVVYAPPPVAYAPPPVVYQPMPSFNVVIPLRF
jgi:hypothetical protein